MSDVYVVRFNDIELEEVKECCTETMNRVVLSNARPEHPERQAALERLLSSARRLGELYDWDDGAQCVGNGLGDIIRDFSAALDDLEGKS